jgi:hypothetical protein
LVISSSVRSPLRSSSALVATVVPIFTRRRARRDRLARLRAEQVADALHGGVAIGLGILRQQLVGDSVPSGRRPITSVKVPPRSIQKSQLPSIGIARSPVLLEEGARVIAWLLYRCTCARGEAPQPLDAARPDPKFQPTVGDKQNGRIDVAGASSGASSPHAADISGRRLAAPAVCRVGHRPPRRSRSAWSTPSAMPASSFAEAKGYFKAAGIEVKFQPFSSASGMIAPLASGELDVGSGAVSAGHYNANERQIPLKFVADKARNAPTSRFNRSLCAAP